MSDIDKRLDEILVKFYNQATKDVYSENNHNGTVYTKAGTKAEQSIKQLMADEFEKLIGQDVHPNKDCPANGFTCVCQMWAINENKLRKELRQKLEEWKK